MQRMRGLSPADGPAVLLFHLLPDFTMRCHMCPVAQTCPGSGAALARPPSLRCQGGPIATRGPPELSGAASQLWPHMLPHEPHLAATIVQKRQQEPQLRSRETVLPRLLTFSGGRETRFSCHVAWMARETQECSLWSPHGSAAGRRGWTASSTPVPCAPGEEKLRNAHPARQLSTETQGCGAQPPPAGQPHAKHAEGATPQHPGQEGTAAGQRQTRSARRDQRLPTGPASPS